MVRSYWLSMFSVVCVGLVAVVGCGSSGPKTVTVTGKVTIDGQPAANCRIDFHPIDDANQAASGQIGEDGSYTLSTGVTGTPGAMPGKYKVVLVPDTGADMSYMETGEDPTTAAPETDLGAVPEEYTSASTTPKEVEVTAGANTINIEIQSDTSADSS